MTFHKFLQAVKHEFVATFFRSYDPSRSLHELTSFLIDQRAFPSLSFRFFFLATEFGHDLSLFIRETAREITRYDLKNIDESCNINVMSNKNKCLGSGERKREIVRAIVRSMVNDTSRTYNFPFKV